MHNIQQVIIHRSGSLTRMVSVTNANKTLISTVTQPDNKVYQKQPAVKTEAVTTAINFSQICGVDKEGAKTAEISSVSLPRLDLYHYILCPNAIDQTCD